MLDQETLFALGDIASSLKEIIPLLKDQKRMSQETGRQTVSKYDIERFLQEYYGTDAEIVIYRHGRLLNVYKQSKTETDTTHG